MPKGTIIAFEGLDNCFKETNVKTFVESINNSVFYDVYTQDFPRYDSDTSYFVKQWLSGNFDREYLKKYPIARCAMYSLDRLAYWMEKNNDGVRNIDILNNDPLSIFVFDRYNISNSIYNPIVNDNSVELADLLFDEVTYGVPRPNIVVWMRNRSLDKYLEMVAYKTNKDKNELDVDYLKEVYERSEKLIHSKLFQIAGIDLIIIDILDCNNQIRSREDIAEEIFTEIKKLF